MVDVDSEFSPATLSSDLYWLMKVTNCMHRLFTVPTKKQPTCTTAFVGDADPRMPADLMGQNFFSHSVTIYLIDLDF